MSDENGNDNEPGFWDHMFNAFGNIAKAQRKAQAEAEAGAGEKRGGKPGKRKLKIAFDEAPEAKDPACCTAKRGE